MSTAALPAGADRTDLLADLWTRSTGHHPDRPIHCAACDVLHLRDCLLQIAGLDDSLIAALCDRCAELATRDLEAIEAAIDTRGRAGRFCMHLVDQVDGYRFVVADTDCECGRVGGAA